MPHVGHQILVVALPSIDKISDMKSKTDITIYIVKGIVIVCLSAGVFGYMSAIFNPQTQHELMIIPVYICLSVGVLYVSVFIVDKTFEWGRFFWLFIVKNRTNDKPFN